MLMYFGKPREGCPKTGRDLYRMGTCIAQIQPNPISRVRRLCVRHPLTRRRTCIQASVLSNKRTSLGKDGLIQPVHQKVTAFAPATIANLGPGFDWLGCAVDGAGDTVTATVLPDRPGQIVIESISQDGGRLSKVPAENCAGIAALETLKLLGPIDCGVSLALVKGLPLGSGMGSSAASAAAGAWAVNALFGEPLSKEELVPPGLASEATVSGYHADNIAPAVLGGFVLIRGCQPLDIEKLQYPMEGRELYFALVNPVFEAPTREMRAVLPKEVALSSSIRNSCMGGSLVAGILMGQPSMIGQALNSDPIVEPVRGPLIPGFAAVKAAALKAGAYGCTISGAGPTCVAVVGDPGQGERVLEAMAKAFREQGGLEVNSARVARLDQLGARTV
eukprot:jgi/Botrbrau1/8652/Bobra.0087s0007.1